MAVTNDARGSESSQDNGTANRPVVQPLPFRPGIRRTPQHIPRPRVVYDGIADTLYFRLDDPSRPVVVSSCHDEFCILIDRESKTWAGFQIENYFAAALAETPQAARLLDFAELRGISRKEAWAARNRALGWQRRLKVWWDWTLFTIQFEMQTTWHRRMKDAPSVSRETAWAQILVAG